MASFNKVILMGNLTRDPQLSYLPSQTPVVEIGLAVNHRYKGQDGQTHDKVCFVDCRMFGKRAEILNQYMRKGQPLMVEGRLELDQWEAQDGSKRSKHRVFIENFTFVGGNQQQQGGGGYQQQGGGYQQPQSQPQMGGYQNQQPPMGGGYQQQPAQGQGGYQNQQPPMGGNAPQAPAAPPQPNSFDAPPGDDDIPF